MSPQLTAIAKVLDIPLATLQEQSVKHFLQKKIMELESELFSIARKYGVTRLKELDRLIKRGKLHETDQTREDFFRIDALEAQRVHLQRILKSVN